MSPTRKKGRSAPVALGFLAAAAAGVIIPSRVDASPIVDVYLTARLDGSSDPFSNSINVQAGFTYDYQLTFTLAPVGTYNAAINKTVDSYRPSTTDGLSTIKGSITQSTGDQIQANFSSAGTNDPAFTGTGTTGGTTVNRGNGYNNLITIQSTAPAGQFLSIDGSGNPVANTVFLTGTFTVPTVGTGTTSTLNLLNSNDTFQSTIRWNALGNGSQTITKAQANNLTDPAIAYHSLTLTANSDIDVTSGSTVTFNLLRHATVYNGASPIWTSNVGLTNSGSSSGSYTSGTSGIVAVTSGGSGTIAASGTATVGIAIASGTSTTTDDSAVHGVTGAGQTGTVTFTGTKPDGQTATLTLHVGQGATIGAGAGVNPLHDFAAATTLTAQVLAGAAYTDLGSDTYNLDVGGTKLAGTVVGSDATIVAGTNKYVSGANGSSTQNINMRWRKRATIESYPTQTNPPIIHGEGLVSDVVDLSGIEETEFNAGGAHANDNNVDSNETHLFVLQMTVPTDAFREVIDNGGILSPAVKAAIQQDVAHQKVYLVSLNNSDQWVNAVTMNILDNAEGLGTNHIQFYNESWATAMTNGEGTATAANFGHFGAYYDSTTDQISVWAVLNHSSQFAVVPEPASVGLLSLGALAAFGRWRRRARRTPAKQTA